MLFYSFSVIRLATRTFDAALSDHANSTSSVCRPSGPARRPTQRGTESGHGLAVCSTFHDIGPLFFPSDFLVQKFQVCRRELKSPASLPRAIFARNTATRRFFGKGVARFSRFPRFRSLSGVTVSDGERLARPERQTVRQKREEGKGPARPVPALGARKSNIAAL